MKTKTPITFLAAAFVAAGLLTVAQAQTNSFDGTYFFTGSTGNTNSLPYNGDSLANVTAGNIDKSAGITNSSSNNNFRATGWTTGGSIDLGDYISFTLEADTGYLFDLTDMTFGVGRSATGTRNWVWYASTNSFSTSFVLTNYSSVNAGLSESDGVLTNPDSNLNWTGNVLDLSDLTGLSQIEFRLYSYNSEAGSGTAGLAGNLNFTGVSYSSGPPPAGDDLYWTANGTTLGGAGTWNTSGTNWSPTDSPVAADIWASTNKAIFTNSAATVTVDDVSVEKGIQFATTGYVLEDGTITLDGATIGDNTITTDADVTATIDSILSGTNGLTKAGTGTLVLGGSNDYEGGTLVSAGRLVGTTGSLQGDITNNSSVAFNQSFNAGFAGDISGSGSLVKTGAGTVTLSGDNTYSGGTEVAAGGLVGTTGSLQGDIINNGTVTFDQSTSGTYAGNMSGTGLLTKEGSGTVTLGGTNTQAGGIEVAAGRIIGTTGSIQGDVLNDGTVTFDQATNGTYAGDMSGAGTLTKSGAGSVTLSGSNTYTGGTEVEEGGIIGTTASLQGDIFNDGEVTFNQTTNGTYADELSGTGSVAKAGAGTVTFSGNNSYEGGTTVNGGTLIAAGDSALGTDSVTITEGTVLAKDGVTTANDFVISGGTKGDDTRLQAWDFTGQNNVATSEADVVDLNLNSGGSFNLLTRGATAGASAGNNSFRTTGFQDDGISTSNTDYFQWSVAASEGNTLYLSSLDARFAGTSSFRASPGVSAQFAYSLDGSNFTLIGSPFSLTADTAMSQIDLSGIVALQGLSSDTTVTFRYYASGQTTTGGWGFNSPSSGSYGLDVGGWAGTEGGGTIGIDEAGEASFTGNIEAGGPTILTAAEDGTAVFSGVISGGGAIDKTGAGTVTFSGSSANTQTGAVTVSAGVLELAKTAGTAAITGDLTVQDGARLLLSTSNQVADTSAVTLSGGTIERASGVSEVFGDLNLTEASFLDYGTGSTGTLTFGSYTPSSLLTVSNFLEGNTLVFSSNLSGQITGNFNFDNGFTTDWNGSTFTITAIPEPAAYAVAAGLIGLMLWPTRRRLLKDAKSILGLRPPARDRLTKRA